MPTSAKNVHKGGAELKNHTNNLPISKQLLRLAHNQSAPDHSKFLRFVSYLVSNKGSTQLPNPAPMNPFMELDVWALNI